MSVTQIREAIDELSYEERLELSRWLAGSTPDEEDESDLQLAHERLAALAAGTKKMIPEDEFWTRIDAFKAGLK